MAMYCMKGPAIIDDYWWKYQPEPPSGPDYLM